MLIRHAWHVVEPSTPYLENWHIDLIAEHLEAVTAGQIKRLLIDMPQNRPPYRLYGYVADLGLGARVVSGHRQAALPGI
jgi:hypothetical protein